MELHEYQYKPTTAALPESGTERRGHGDPGNTRAGWITLCVFAVCFTAICITGMLLMWG